MTDPRLTLRWFAAMDIDGGGHYPPHLQQAVRDSEGKILWLRVETYFEGDEDAAE